MKFNLNPNIYIESIKIDDEEFSRLSIVLDESVVNRIIAFP